MLFAFSEILLLKASSRKIPFNTPLLIILTFDILLKSDSGHTCKLWDSCLGNLSPCICQKHEHVDDKIYCCYCKRLFLFLNWRLSESAIIC